MKPSLLLLPALLLLGACTSVPPRPVGRALASLAQAKQAIAKSNQLYWQAFSKGDSALFIERYATDACIMPANVPALCGPTAAPTFYRVAYQQMGIRDGRFTTQAVWGGNDDYVTEQGTFELRDGRGAVLDRGKYLVLWKKTAIGWQMFRDSFSSDAPNPPSKAPGR